MSDQTGHEDLDGYLLGGSALSKAYATLDKPMPTATLDVAVMDQASKALRDPEALSSGGRRRHWMVPASVAAVVLLAFPVVMRVIIGPFEQEAETAIPSLEPQNTVLERAKPGNPRPSPASIDGQGPLVSPVTSAPAAPPVDEPAMDRPSGPQRPAMIQQPAKHLLETQKQIDNLRGLTPAQSIGEKDTRDPARWLDEIEALANDGELTEAQAELERFRNAYPEHSVDSELQQLSR